MKTVNENRWILHVDMDSFYVSVERLKNPSLLKKPVAVGGRGLRSVISSASYEARHFGVRAAMPTQTALRLCPELILVPPSFSDYSEISHLIFDNLRKLAPVFQKVSIDEAYLDMSGCDNLYLSRRAFGVQIKQTVLQLSKLTCSVGIGSNKMIAKIASDFLKPDGLHEVVSGTEREFLSLMSLEKIPGVGKKTFAILQSKGLYVCKDLALKNDMWVRENLGSMGIELRAKTLGLDSSAVHEERLRKSMSNETTFERNVSNPSIIQQTLLDLIEEVCFDLRKEGLVASTVQIKFRFGDFSTFTRAKKLLSDTNLAQEIAPVAMNLLKLGNSQNKPLRLLGVSLTALRGEVEPDQTTISLANPLQLSLFDDQHLKQHAKQHPNQFSNQQVHQKVNQKVNQKRLELEKAKDLLKNKFGKKVFMSHTEKRAITPKINRSTKAHEN